MPRYLVGNVKGDTGNGIANVTEKSVVNDDINRVTITTFTINFTNGESTDFSVQTKYGEDGSAISSIDAKKVIDTFMSLNQEDINKIFDKKINNLTIPDIEINGLFTERISATNYYEIEDSQAKVLDLSGNTIKQVNPLVDTYTMAEYTYSGYYKSLYVDRNYNAGSKFFVSYDASTISDNVIESEIVLYNDDNSYSILRFPKDNYRGVITIPKNANNLELRPNRNIDGNGSTISFGHFQLYELPPNLEQAPTSVLQQLLSNVLGYGIHNSKLDTYKVVGNNQIDINEINDYSKYVYNTPVNNYVKRVLKGLPNTTYYVSVDGNVKLPSVYWLISGKINNSGWVALSHAISGTQPQATFTTDDSGDIYVQMLGGSQSAIDTILADTTFAISLGKYIDPHTPYKEYNIDFDNVELSQWDRVYSPSGDLSVDMVKENNVVIYNTYGNENNIVVELEDDSNIKFKFENVLVDVEYSNTGLISEVFQNREDGSSIDLSLHGWFVEKYYNSTLLNKITVITSKSLVGSNLEQIKTYFKNKPQKFYIKLATPTIEQLTPLAKDNVPITNYGTEYQITSTIPVYMNIRYLMNTKSQIEELSKDNVNHSIDIQMIKNIIKEYMNEFITQNLIVKYITAVKDYFIEIHSDLELWGSLDMDGNEIKNLKTPNESNQAANKGYVDNEVSDIMQNLNLIMEVTRYSQTVTVSMVGSSGLYTGVTTFVIGKGRGVFESNYSDSSITGVLFDYQEEYGSLKVTVGATSSGIKSVQVSYLLKV